MEARWQDGRVVLIALLGGVVGGLAFGLIIGVFVLNGSFPQSSAAAQEIADLQQQLADEKAAHEQNEKDWEAADAAFLAQHCFFHADSKTILGLIGSRYAGKTESNNMASTLVTNLGATVRIYTDGKNVTSAYVSFQSSKSDHGLDVVELVAMRLVGPSRETRNAVASAAQFEHGVLLYRYAGAIVGTTIKDEGKRIEVAFTPTRNR